VPFNGGGELASAVMGGHVDFGLGSLTSHISLVVAGKMRALAVTGRARLKALPDVPTFEEQGVSGDFVDSWAGAFAPRGTPQPIVDMLVERASRVVKSPDFVAKIEKVGIVAPPMSSAEILAMIRDQQRMAAVFAARVGIAGSAR
jgi:tripartite-type tricarboxylate transporter receptor subunit TctC